jgi:predicted DCC family thiol-disulfide oxidoreductase YuxK
MSWQKAPVPREAYSYRADPAVPAFWDARAIVIFDGTCVLCSSFAQFIMRHDRNRELCFLAAQTPLGTALYTYFGLDPINNETIILLEDGIAWFKSEGSIRIFEHLGLPWSLISAGRWLPAALQDRFYDVIARNRFHWFGKRATCYLPDPSEAGRFIA